MSQKQLKLNKDDAIQAFTAAIPKFVNKREISVMDVSHTYLLTFNADGALDPYGTSENIPDDAIWLVPDFNTKTASK